MVINDRLGELGLGSESGDESEFDDGDEEEPVEEVAEVVLQNLAELKLK